MTRFKVPKGWGLKIQLGSTSIDVMLWPFAWELWQDRMAPRLYGIGVWITRDVWVD